MSDTADNDKSKSTAPSLSTSGGTRTCVSAAAAGRADGFLGRPVGDLVLRRRKEPMRVLTQLAQLEASFSNFA